MAALPIVAVCVAGVAVVVNVTAIVVSAALNRRAVRTEQHRRLWDHRLDLARQVVDDTRLDFDAGFGRPIEDDRTRLARTALDSLPGYYLPLHRVVLFPADPQPGIVREPASKRGISDSLRLEGRVTLKALVAGDDPPPFPSYDQADQDHLLGPERNLYPPAPPPG